MAKLITRSGKLISRGGNLISKSDPPPSPAACWEGVMTVGESSGFFGYIEGFIGVMSNLPILNCSSQGINQIYWYNDTLSTFASPVNEIEINGVIIDMEGVNEKSPIPNPFPPVGETCIIKILS